jgi:hypothetical protein
MFSGMTQGSSRADVFSYMKIAADVKGIASH